MINEQKPKLIKIRFEYENHISELEGEDVERWEKAVNEITVLAWSHGIKIPPDLKWNKIKKEKP
jgi:hypothetical protein